MVQAVYLLVEAMQAINRNLWILSVLVLLCTGGGVLFLFKKAPPKDEEILSLIKEEGYFIPLKIYGYSFTNMPFLEVSIGNKTIPAKIDLGFHGMFSLPSDLIKNIDEKRRIGRTQSYGLRGRIYENDVYELKKINIDKMSFPAIKVKEVSLESMLECVLEGTHPPEYRYGTIGWQLFSDYNLLVDCRNYILALCDSLETLKQQRYPIDAFTEVPMISNSSFITFEAVTEGGPLRCILDTGSTDNILNKDLEKGCNDHQIPNSHSGGLAFLNPENKDLLIYDPEDIQELSSFKIGGKEFGPITFRRIKSPLQIDAILGMEFFDSHLIFIDFANEKIYFAPYPKEAWQKPDLRPTIGPIRCYNL